MFLWGVTMVRSEYWNKMFRRGPPDFPNTDDARNHYEFQRPHGYVFVMR